ncbi:MAG TPA: glycosyltransferase [Chloroflexota bacterium]|nr:glycosyltransferase [Chloroflexota bacterium]
MRILFLTPQLPFPARQGTQMRNLQIIQAAARAHQVDLVSFARKGETVDADSPLAKLCGEIRTVPAPTTRGRKSRLRDLALSPEPDLAFRLRSPEFESALRFMLSVWKYDAVQVEALEMATYLPVVRLFAPHAAVIFDAHNCEYLIQARAAAVDARLPSTWPKAAYSLIQCGKLKEYEAAVCRRAGLVLAVSQSDADTLYNLGLSARPLVVPNGVDASSYRPDLVLHPEHDSLLFTGTMDYRPNVDAVEWFAKKVLPIIVRKRPGVTLRIVGRAPSPRVMALAEDPMIEVTGEVDDVRPYFSRSSLFVVPIRMAGGARLKILEAMAMGLPVVSTTMGAEGIDLLDGEDALLADDADGFADAVVKLLEDPAFAGKLAFNGRRLVEYQYDWEQVAPLLLKSYSSIGA